MKRPPTNCSPVKKHAVRPGPVKDSINVHASRFGHDTSRLNRSGLTTQNQLFWEEQTTETHGAMTCQHLTLIFSSLPSYPHHVRQVCPRSPQSGNPHPVCELTLQDCCSLFNAWWFKLAKDDRGSSPDGNPLIYAIKTNQFKKKPRP